MTKKRLYHQKAVQLTIITAAFIVLCACGASADLPTLTPPQATYTAIPTLGPTTIPQPTAVPTTIADTGWLPYSTGIETRSINVILGESVERVTVVRCDPAQVQLKVAYTPGQATSIGGWSARTSALMVINGGYFSEGNEVTGLTISEGQAYGYSYGDFAGMFTVDAGLTPSLRWLRQWPYNPGEGLQYAVQSFPILVKPGGEMGFPADADDGRVSRRSVVAQDRSGRFLFLVAPRGYFSLHELSVWLSESDLDIDMAVNLDGGTSTGLWMPNGPQIESMIPVPVVILVQSR